jgi:hypothetical protein
MRRRKTHLRPRRICYISRFIACRIGNGRSELWAGKPFPIDMMNIFCGFATDATGKNTIVNLNDGDNPACR